MIIIFKCLGAFLGLRVALWMGSPPFSGLIIGGILGHSLDIIVSTKFQRAKARRYWSARAKEEYKNVFLVTVFSMLGKLAGADAEINAAETAAVEKIITDTLKLKRRERKEALQIFQSARRLPTSFQFDAAQYFEIHQRDPQSLENFLCVLFDVAMADGKVNEAEEKLIRSAAVVFNIPESRFGDLQAHYLGTRSKAKINGSSGGISHFDPYTILGCNRTDSVSVIKQSYRKLVSDYHPDKIVSKDLPEDFTRFANEKFKSIQEAYEAVKSEKGFS